VTAPPNKCVLWGSNLCSYPYKDITIPARPTLHLYKILFDNLLYMFHEMVRCDGMKNENTNRK